MYNTSEIIAFAKDHRAWCKENLPFYESVVAYDLILLLASKFLNNEEVNVKYIFNQLPHSYTAVRQHYKRLIEDGWIKNIMAITDKRIKHIIPTNKFNAIIEKYAQYIYENAPKR